MPTTTRRPAARPARPARALLLPALVALGLLVSAFRVAGVLDLAGTREIGDTVRTSFGSLAVTHARVAFVPDTQGPPTMARMAGRVGTGQLQVWVRLVNDQEPGGHRYSPAQFRLLDTRGHRVAPDGSTLQSARLPEGAAVDGQLWFDLHGAPPAKGSWVLELGHGRDRVRIAVAAGPDSAGASSLQQHQHEGNAHAH